MIIFNHAICKITVHPKSENESREVRVFKRRVGFKWNGIIPTSIYKEEYCVVGFWSDEIISSVDEYQDELTYVEDGAVYYYPHCVIYLANQDKREIYFETIEEMEKYVKELSSKAPHIEV